MLIETISTPMLFFVCAMMFLAGFVDSIAGGGGCISLPAYLFTGLPTQTAFACNKFTSACGTTFAALRYFANGAINLKVSAASAVTAFIGAVIASKIVLMLDPTVFQKLLVFVLPFAAAFLLIKRDFGEHSGFEDIPKSKVYFLAATAGLVLGFYDGLIGPGTGTFAIAIFSGVLKFDLKTASGNAKILNIASSYASAISFMVAGLVIYQIALLTAAFGIAGNIIGSNLAIKKGAGFIRIMMTVVVVLLLSKLLFDMLA
jgi:uncharacterized membrane protein YfcA